MAALALAASLAIGGSVAWAETAATLPATPAPGARNPAAVDAFKKARDLFQQDKLQEANTENEKALQIDPNYADALTLRHIIQGKLAEGPSGSETTAATTGPAGLEKVRTLKPSDITLLRINEWEPDVDARVPGRVNRKTLEDFWTDVVKKQGDSVAATKEAHDAFVNAGNFAGQVKRIKESGDLKYMEKVEFSTDPAALLNYRKNIQPYVMSQCANCHTGDKGGNFRLIKPANAATDTTLYTNFYILSQYANKDGQMIDREKPENSLLLQYGMIKSAAVKPHPGKVEVRFFTDKSDPKFQAMVDWIKSLAFPAPNYGIVYELPGAAPAAPAPATAPAPTTRPKAPAPKAK